MNRMRKARGIHTYTTRTDNDMEEPTVQHKLESTGYIQTFMVHFFRSETNRGNGIALACDCQLKQTFLT